MSTVASINLQQGPLTATLSFAASDACPAASLAFDSVLAAAPELLQAFGKGVQVLERSQALQAEAELQAYRLPPRPDRPLTTPPGAPMEIISTILPAPGQYLPEQGGTYAGIMRGAPGQPAHHLIVATGPAGMASGIAWGPEDIQIPGADSEWDGLANTLAIVASGTECPAATWCNRLEIGFHTDWYLPSRRELALCYANVPELFEERFHWSSTQYSACTAWSQSVGTGHQYVSAKGYEARARAVRRLVLQSFNPLVA